MAVGASRYSFTAQFVAGAVLLARRAAEIEQLPAPTPLQQAEHRALVVAAIMEAASALESELNEILEHGVPHHVGSNAAAAKTAAFLEPVADAVDGVSGVLDRWSLVMHLLQRPGFRKGQQPYQDADLLIGLRNELVHYRSKSGGATRRGTLLKGLHQKRFPRPHFVSMFANQFPKQILSAACATWASKTAAWFIDTAYFQLGVPGVLDANRMAGADFRDVLPPKRAYKVPPAG